MEGTYLVHHGIKGQRWGIRRYQNEDGSLTDAGRKRYLKDLGLPNGVNRGIRTLIKAGEAVGKNTAKGVQRGVAVTKAIGKGVENAAKNTADNFKRATGLIGAVGKAIGNNAKRGVERGVNTSKKVGQYVASDAKKRGEKTVKKLTDSKTWKRYLKVVTSTGSPIADRGRNIVQGMLARKMYKRIKNISDGVASLKEDKDEK